MKMVKTRLEKDKENKEEKLAAGGKSNDSEIDDILNPLRTNFANISALLDKLEKRFEEKYNQQELEIDNLKTRVKFLEGRTEFIYHMAEMNERKIDDGEQVSKKVNLRIEGIIVEKDETPDTILTKIKDDVKKCGIEIPDIHYDRCHRDGRKWIYKGETHQAVLLRMCFWKDRDTIYQNRKSLPFKVYPHLTKRRKQIIDFARKQLERDDRMISKVIDFVFVDKNCKMKLRSMKGRFYGFSTKNEFLNLAIWLLKEDEAFNVFCEGMNAFSESKVSEDSSEKVSDDDC